MGHRVVKRLPLDFAAPLANPDAGPTLTERQLAAARATIRRELALRELSAGRLPETFRRERDA